MRNLSIRREKSFIACLGKMKVYAEDPNGTDLVIDNVPCRKLGVLKNGEEVTFEIGDQPMRVFVIVDKVSRNFCSEYFFIPEGTEDIRLAGKNRFNPFVGNPFQFYNNDSPEIIENRKKNARKGLLFLIIVAVIAAVFGYMLGYFMFSKIDAEPEVFTSHGVTITLTDEFIETSYDGVTVTFESENVAVFAIEESFSWYEGVEDLSLREYGELASKVNNVETSGLKIDGDLMYYEYEEYNDELKRDYTYYAFVYKSDDSFWMINFVTASINAEEYESKIFAWADSVEFDS